MRSTATDSSQDGQRVIGTEIDGKYRLLRPLGSGGMAEVWLATHEQLRQEVAIKFVSAPLLRDPELAPLVLDRFRFEAQISARLAIATRHIVAVRDAGVHEGLPYLVMEFVDGRTLEAEVAACGGALTPAHFADVLDQIAKALDAAHEMGVVHRDLKPSNVMLTTHHERLVVKVADFGIAKALECAAPIDRPQETVAGALVGSPWYMSPEQIMGSPDVDARSDVWALGALAFEVLTGRACFDGDTAGSVIARVLSGEVPRASSVRITLPRSLDAWFARALAQAPAARFATAGEAAVAFRDALVQSTGRARRAAICAMAIAAAGLLASPFAAARARLSSAAPRTDVPAIVVPDPAPVAPPRSIAATPAVGVAEPASAPNVATPKPIAAPAPVPNTSRAARVVVAPARRDPAKDPPKVAARAVNPSEIQ